jgi:II/X family phage/plasmid replication protein
MLIDWLTLRVPLSPYPALAQRVHSSMGRVNRANPDGEIVETRDYLDIDHLRSDTVGICWQVNTSSDFGRMLVIGASPANLEFGNNVFGAQNPITVGGWQVCAATSLPYCAGVLISAAEKALGVSLPTYKKWQLRRIDVTENYAMQTEDQVKEALRALRGADAPRSRAYIMGGDTVGWNKGSDRFSGKAYHKGPQLRKLARPVPGGLPRTTATQEQIELAHRMLRLELKIGSRFFREHFRDYMIETRGQEAGTMAEWYDLNESDLSKWHEQYFAQFFGAMEVTDMNHDILKRLRECMDSKGQIVTENQAMAAYSTWLRIKAIGYDQTKANMPRATWFRHTSYLKQCGLSQADLSSATVLPFRKRTVLLNPCQSWDDLRRYA